MYQIIEFKNLFSQVNIGGHRFFSHSFAKHFLYCHEGDERFNNVFQANRKLAGYYVKGTIKVAFYYKPSWYSRQKMYWFYGWYWENVT